MTTDENQMVEKFENLGSCVYLCVSGSIYMRSIIQIIILILALLSCGEKSKTSNTLPKDFTDTIRRTEVQKFADGDSLVEYQTITFTPNDFTIPIDSFYYEASSRRHEKGESYRIYFDKEKVIAYCDSMLKSLGPETLNNFDARRQMYISILKNAKEGFGDAIFVSETHYLMNRFRPLIVNPETGHKPGYYFTINRRSSQREDIEREFVTQKGDTFSLSWKNIWIADLKIHTRK
jgi:hypothetical protein